ncbi:MAG: CHAD domain-containing protein [Planctomycetes bacterium]|nr:CHAD domain-containing protein [Planctomycetota bacterium]
MADGKWIEGLGPKAHTAEAARRVLEVRLHVVRICLPLAVHEADRDVEHVHRLRVATRRAGAALKIFRPCLPEKAFRRVRKQLRAMRRAAGEARDWDVFVADLLQRRKQCGVKEQPGLDFLIGHGSEQRDAAQVHLVEAGEEYGPGLAERIDETVKGVREPQHDKTAKMLDDLGRVLLGDLVREFDWAASQNLDDYEHLHRVRILGKQLRYAMEVFADCFSDVFREELYPRVEEMQEVLGNANDSHVASQRLGTLRERLRLKWPEDWKRYQPGLDALLRFHRRRLPRERERFLNWWRRWQTSDSQRLHELLRDEPVTIPQATTAPPGGG